MYRKYRIVECIASSVSQYESYRDQVYRYTPKSNNLYPLHLNNLCLSFSFWHIKDDELWKNIIVRKYEH